MLILLSSLSGTSIQNKDPDQSMKYLNLLPKNFINFSELDGGITVLIKLFFVLVNNSKLFTFVQNGLIDDCLK